MTRLTSLILAAACITGVVGAASPGAAHQSRLGNRCDWVHHREWTQRFDRRAQLPRTVPRGFGHDWRHRPLAARQIAAGLRRQGYRHVRNVEYRRGVYRAVAEGRRGRPVAVFVHPTTGRVMCAEPIRRHAYTRHHDAERRHGRGGHETRDRRRHGRLDWRWDR